MKEIFEGNKKWVEDTLAKDPAFFDNLSKGQTPEYLWIGCSDSRVPANEIVNLPPGSIFVQRNIANQVINSDMNLLSVVYYAVKYLKVKHILVVGHYGCGGVAAAMSNNSFGFLDNWLVSIKNVYLKNQAELEAISDMDDRTDRLVELNAIQQSVNMAKISFIQEEWSQGNPLEIHALVYSLNDGKLRDLNTSINSATDLKPVFQFYQF
ncbi:MAG: Carbonate dehydratase [Fluviicola sp.]|jgi:carbonic anhydrase|uniref:carbonic anhydrase n=1 Tax=Fluviicola sp. TaxID=1917219 RepID=UPI002629FEC8|nr:carbonic anhydrase [Fluviicola sp.]MDF3027438.1 Carbonate dehydratase [Fluviicola sp.]